MMKFVPRVNVVYHGELHPSQKAFEIDEADAEEMKRYGEVIQPEEKDSKPVKTAKKAGNRQ